MGVTAPWSIALVIDFIVALSHPVSLRSRASASARHGWLMLGRGGVAMFAPMKKLGCGGWL